jgi:hypothetical protein
MKSQTGKKGSQMDMIISFTIFIASLMFIYFIFTSLVYKPNTARDSLGTVENNVIQAVSSHVWVLRFYNSSNSGACFEVPVPENISNAETSGSGDSGPVYSEISGGNIYFNGTGFMKIYYSDGVENVYPFSGSGCTLVTPDSERTEDIITQKNVASLMSNFSGNYIQTKNMLGVPSSMDLNLKFEYSNGTSVGGSVPVPDTNVYSGLLNVDYLSYNGSYETGSLQVEIW